MEYHPYRVGQLVMYTSDFSPNHHLSDFAKDVAAGEKIEVGVVTAVSEGRVSIGSESMPVRFVRPIEDQHPIFDRINALLSAIQELK